MWLLDLVGSRRKNAADTAQSMDSGEDLGSEDPEHDSGNVESKQNGVENHGQLPGVASTGLKHGSNGDTSEKRGMGNDDSQTEKKLH